MGTNEELHPNWRALATIHLPLKRFVRAGLGNIEKGNCNVGEEKYEIQNVDGKEIKQFYEDVLQQAGSKSLTTRSQAKAAADCTKSLKKLATTKEVKIQPFALQKYFRLATENQVEQLKCMEIPLEQLDACDCYGWSALMMRKPMKQCNICSNWKPTQIRKTKLVNLHAIWPKKRKVCMCKLCWKEKCKLQKSLKLLRALNSCKFSPSTAKHAKEIFEK